MDPNKAILVCCITLFLVIGINAAIYVSVSRKNTVGQIELMRRAARQVRNPWGKEDADLQELATHVSKIKALREKGGGVRPMNNKQISIDEAARLVPPGCTLALGGMTLYRRPMAFVRAMLKRHQATGEPSGLTLLAFTGGPESDLLIGAGMVKRVRSCYFGLEIFGLAPMFTYFANRGEIEIVEETEASLAFGLRAYMAGVGFMPGRGWLGTDLPRLRPDVRTVVDPYTGETLIAFPAIHPNVAVIHAIRADAQGNAQIGDNKAVDEELFMTSDMVIITAEEIVPELKRADLVAPLVHAVVLAPRGAAPTSCHPLYPLDGEAILDYAEQVSDPPSFAAYIARWLDS